MRERSGQAAFDVATGHAGSGGVAGVAGVRAPHVAADVAGLPVGTAERKIGKRVPG
ncbi:hypothetical protein [Streptosporangium sp. KLBMP 9127]|nr:hypothetical protein [Streptosporangium sp. KLBMP 9127]